MSRGAYFVCAALVFCFGSTTLSQNGRIIDTRTFTLDDSVALRLSRTAADTLGRIQRIQMREITYLSDGIKVKGFLLVPKQPGKHPVLIFNRGGCKNYGAMDRRFASDWLTLFADWGYVVVASQYRGSGGSEGKDEFGGADVNDVLNLLPLIDSLPEADPSRIGIWSESRGGIMTYLMLTRTDRIRGAVISSTPTDISTLSAYRRANEPKDDFEEFCLRDVIPDYDHSAQKALAARSAIKWPEKLNKTTPILLVQGTADWRSNPRYTLDMASELLRLKHPFRLVMFEGGDHVLNEYTAEFFRISADFLGYYVRDRKTWPSLEPHGR